MSYFVLGVNHKSAPLSLRERLAAPSSAAERLAIALGSGADEALLLQTCNRVELIGEASASYDAAEMARSVFGAEAKTLGSSLYDLRGEAAVLHVFRVASSLDSMVVGEAQILGQLKQAHLEARRTGAAGRRLEELLTRAYGAAKKVRGGTQIAANSVSIASVAVERARRIFGDLQGRSAHLVGAGRMSELAARHLRAHGVGEIVVYNRSLGRAQELASEFGGRALPMSEMYAELWRADIVITATAAPHCIFTRTMVEGFLERRRWRPMFFLDIAAPRDCEPSINELEDAFVYDIDDLQQLAEENLDGRRREAELAASIVEHEVERFAQRLRGRRAGPAIVALRGHLEELRVGELERHRAKLAGLSDEQREAVEALTRGLVNKILHAPAVELRRAAEDGDASAARRAVDQLFGMVEDEHRCPGERAAEEAEGK